MVSPQRRAVSARTVALVTLLGVAATTFPVTVLSASLPEVATDLNTSDTTVAWVITAPLLAVAVLTPMAGKLGDLYGHRRMYLVGFAAAAVFQLLTALSPNVGTLVVLRTLASAAAAPTGPAALAILLKVFPGNRRNQAMGWWGATVAASPAVGVVIGGPLVDWFGWQLLFVIQGAIALVAVGLAWQVLPATGERRRVRFDVAGAITLGIGVGAILLGVNRGPAWGWASTGVLAALFAGPVFLGLFSLVERRAAEPLLPPEILRRPLVLLLFGSQTVNQAAYMGGFVVSPFLLSRVFGYGITATSLIMVGRPIAFSVGAWWSGRVSHRLPPARTATRSIALVALALFATGLGAQLEMVIVLIVAMTITGLGMGFGRPVVMTAVSRTVVDRDLGVASGTYQMVVTLGSAMGISTLTTIIGDSDAPARFLGVFIVAAAAALVAAVGTHVAMRGVVEASVPVGAEQR